MNKLFILLLILFSFACNNSKTGQSVKNTNTITYQVPNIFTPGTDTITLPKVVLITTANAPKKGNATAKPTVVANPFNDGLGIPHFTNYDIEDGLALSSISTCFTDTKGNLWFGTFGGGVSKYDGKSFTTYTKSQGLAENSVSAICEDKAGNLWFGTNGGLSKYDGKSFTTYTKSQGMMDGSVQHITMLQNGQKMALSGSLGLWVVSFNPKLSPNHGQSQAQLQDNNHTHLSTTHDFSDIQHYHINTGYPVKDVNFLYADKNDVLWVAGNNELQRVELSSLNKNLQPLTLEIKQIKIHEEHIAWYNLQQHFNNTKLANTTTNIAAQLIEEQQVFQRSLTPGEKDSLYTKYKGIKFDGITKWYPLPENLVLPHKHNNISFEFGAVETGRNQFVTYQYKLEGYNDEWGPLTNNTSATFGNMSAGDYTFMVRCVSPYNENIQTTLQYKFKVLPPWYLTWWAYILYVFGGMLIIGSYIKYREAALRKEKQILESTVQLRTQELREEKKTVETQKHIIEEKHRDLTDSINYAERIQKGFLVSREFLNTYLKTGFILFNPRDTVSGDFYWAEHLGDNRIIVSVADSTGHGIPGAFLSLLNIAFLKEAVASRNLTNTADILNFVRESLINNIKPNELGEGGNDGMDCVLFTINYNTLELELSGAQNSLWIVRALPNTPGEKQIIELKGDKMPVGRSLRAKESFTSQRFQLQKGDVIYASTDGFPDQFGGEKEKKFMHKHLKTLLISISHLHEDEQKQILQNTLDTWRGNLEQVDDITIMGIKL